MLLPYLFDATLNFSSSPFGPELPSSLALSRLRGMFAVQSPLPSSKPKALKLPSNFRSPSGLSSFRIVALSRWLGLRNLPLSPARFPFAPRKRQSLFNNYPLTDHRSRFATVYQAYCSLNLSEPCPCCPEMPFESTMKWRLQSVFQRFYFAWIQQFTGFELCRRCG